MYKICAVFEDWYIEDGSFPELHVGQKIDTTISLNVNGNFKKVKENKTDFLKIIKYSEYSFSGKIHSDNGYISLGNNEEIIFPLYRVRNKKDFRNGDIIKGVGNFYVNHVSENFPFEVLIDKIYKVNIPERFISRSKNGLNHPASLNPEFYPDENVHEVDMIRNTIHDNVSPLTAEVVFHLLELSIVSHKFIP